MADDSLAELAEVVVHTLDPDVSRFVLDQGALYLSALQVASHALDARATQVATILFAAAALSASVVGTSLSWSSVLAALSALFFLWGGIATFRILRSDPIRLPGVAPAWWQGAMEIQPFTTKEAWAWAARLQQLAIENIECENKERAVALNAGLRLAVVGGCLIGLAATLRLAPAFGTWWDKVN